MITQMKTADEIPSVSALDAADHPRHRWYFFKEAFSPEIVDHAIKNASPPAGALIVDPFCGSGTVPLQAALRGYQGWGVEVNPFLAFVARTKLLRCSAKAFEGNLASVRRAIRRGAKCPIEGFSTFTQVDDNSRWLFNRPVIRAFEGGWRASLKLKSPVSNLMRLCLLESALAACNATKDGKCLRYKRGWQELSLDLTDFQAAFEARAEIVASDLKEGPHPDAKAEILQGDIRKERSPKRFRLCITSPPYLNSFDYTDVYRPELFLGRFVTTMAQLRKLRLSTIRSHVQANWPRAEQHSYGNRYTQSLRLVSERVQRLWDRRIPEMIKAYFEDMDIVLRSLRSRAESKASMWIVISTSAYAGVEIPVDLIIADIARQCGWYLREVRVLRYLDRVSGQQWDELRQQKESGPRLRESVVILDAQPRHGRRGTGKKSREGGSHPRRGNR